MTTRLTIAVLATVGVIAAEPAIARMNTSFAARSVSIGPRAPTINPGRSFTAPKSQQGSGSAIKTYNIENAWPKK